MLFAVIANPYAIVAAQLLDGVSAAVLGVMLPLIVADATRASGRFNLALGVVGSAMGIGASLSTKLAVARDTPLAAATSFSVTRFGSRILSLPVSRVASTVPND